MEDMSKKCVESSPYFAYYKPPINPKPNVTGPSSTTTINPIANRSYEPWQSPYFINYDGATSSGSKPQIPPSVLSMNPITNFEPSSSYNSGIIVKSEEEVDYEMKRGCNLNPNMDEKRLKRILSNRLSAQKSRLRKLIYVNELEKKATDLQAEIAKLAPLMGDEEEHNNLLRIENSMLKEKLCFYEDRSKLSLGLIEEQREVVKRLRELYEIQRNTRLQEQSLMLSLNNQPRMEQMTDFWSYDYGSQAMKGFDSEQGEMDPALNFETLTIDPPKSLTGTFL